MAITGGAGGIGAALATALREAGASVVTMDLDGRGADVSLDVTDAAASVAAFGSMERLDVVIANAGIGVSGRFADLEASAWQRIVDVNIAGTVNTLLASLPRLRRQRRGAVVLMASLGGLVGAPLMAPYSMTKHALVGLAASLRPELAADGIGVTVVCPGPVDTPLLDEPSATPGISVRRYLTAAAGNPIAPSKLAAAVVDGVRRDRAVVAPGRAALLWRLQRLAPSATLKQLGRNMASELRHAAQMSSTSST